MIDSKGSAHHIGLSLVGLWLALVFCLCCSSAHAEKRHPDPDGCFSCHGLPDLKYVDQQGQLRSASILMSDYYGSLHGSVPCKDCHRKITDYPHEEKDGLVDCGETCHVKEPSAGKSFTHKKVVEEFEKSSHGKGWSKKFAAGNRAKEDQESSQPSCRRCHANVPYIADKQKAAFKEAFAHNDTECGTCHEGDVWREQFSGHILRRYIGNHLNKSDSNQICIDCHGDIKKMEKVEQEDPKTKEKNPVSQSFIHSVETYQKTLHGRLLKDGGLQGASCVECHAPEGLHHAIRNDNDPAASVHADHLSQTCGQSGCHGDYAKNAANLGFLKTKMHAIDMIAVGLNAKAEKLIDHFSPWQIAAAVLGSLAVIFGLGSLLWQVLGDRSKLGKNTNNSILGAEKFQTIIIGSKPKSKTSHWKNLNKHLTALLLHGYRQFVAQNIKRLLRTLRRLQWASRNQRGNNR